MNFYQRVWFSFGMKIVRQLKHKKVRLDEKYIKFDGRRAIIIGSLSCGLGASCITDKLTVSFLLVRCEPAGLRSKNWTTGTDRSRNWRFAALGRVLSRWLIGQYSAALFVKNRAALCAICVDCFRTWYVSVESPTAGWLTARWITAVFWRSARNVYKSFMSCPISSQGDLCRSH